MNEQTIFVCPLLTSVTRRVGRVAGEVIVPLAVAVMDCEELDVSESLELK